MKAVDQRRGKDVDETELKMKQTGGLAMGKKTKTSCLQYTGTDLQTVPYKKNSHIFC